MLSFLVDIIVKRPDADFWKWMQFIVKRKWENLDESDQWGNRTVDFLMTDRSHGQSEERNKKRDRESNKQVKDDDDDDDD